MPSDFVLAHCDLAAALDSLGDVGRREVRRVNLSYHSKPVDLSVLMQFASDFQGLDTLYLQGSRVLGDLTELARLQGLRHVYVDRIQFSPAEIARLARASAHLEFVEAGE